MHAVTSGGRYALAGLLSGALVLTLPGTASASWPPGTLISKVTYSGSVRSRGSGTAVQPVGNWTPPACWYEPEFRDIYITASLDVGGLHIQATTTARPVSLRLEPGTGDAGTYPASGVCTPNADGSIGEKYARGDADRVPPCGIRYLRSSGHGTYHLKATITRRTIWNGSGGAGGDLADGTFGTTQDIAVQEIQAVNR